MYTNPTSRAEAQGNGVATNFPVALQVYDVSHLKVWRFVPASQELSLLVRGTDYLLTLDADFLGCQVQFIHDLGGGPVVFAPPSGHEFVFLRVVPYTQEQDLRTYGATDKEGLERQLDLLAMGLSQLSEELSRAIKVNVAGSEVNPDALLQAFSDAVNASAASAASAASSASTANTAKLAAQDAQEAAEAAAENLNIFTAAWDFIVGSGPGAAIKKTAAEVCAYFTAMVGAYTKQQYMVPVDLGNSASGPIQLDLDTQADVKFIQVGAITFVNPTNMAHGKYLTLTFWGANAAFALSWGTAFVGNADVALPTTSISNQRMFLTFRCDDAGRMVLMGKVVA